MNKHLILIDDRKVIHYGLKALIESASSWKVLLEAQGKEDLIQKLKEFTFSENDFLAAIVDIKCGNDNGFEIINLLKKKIPGIKCIIYTDYSTYGNLMYAFERGVDGFLSKSSDETEIIQALDAVFQGKTYIEQNLMKEILLISNRLAHLTSREKQVYDLICEDFDKKEICAKLKISIRTCENYFSILYSKLCVSGVEEIQEKFGVKNREKTGFADYSSSVSEDSETPPKRLTLTQDKSYTGDGVKFLYTNVPKEASVLEITLRSPGKKEEQISFMEDDDWGKNREYYNLGYYVYPFLNKVQEYTFDFVFKTKNRELVEKTSITVVPEKGKEVFIKKINRNNVSINPENLICTFTGVSLPDLPPDARLCVNMWTSNWQYIGCMYREFAEIKNLGPFDFYKDIDYCSSSVDLSSVKKVLFQFSFAYECYEWNFFVSDTFPFSSDK